MKSENYLQAWSELRVQKKNELKRIIIINFFTRRQQRHSSTTTTRTALELMHEILFFNNFFSATLEPSKVDFYSSSNPITTPNNPNRP